MNILGAISIALAVVMVATVWCCLRVGAQADKDIEKLERPDLINFTK